MANLCFNSVYLLGEPKKLYKIEKVIKELMDESRNGHRTTLENVQKRLNFNCENWGRTYDSGLDHLDSSDIQNGKLFLEVCTAWSGVSDYWNALCNAFDIEYSCMSETDGDIYIENDCEKRYFPYEFRLDFWGDENNYGIDTGDEFDCKENLLKYLTEKSGKDYSYDEWCDILDDEEIGCIIEIERDGQQAIIKM